MQCGYQQQQAPPGWILPIGLALAGRALSSQVHLLQAALRACLWTTRLLKSTCTQRVCCSCSAPTPLLLALRTGLVQGWALQVWDSEGADTRLALWYGAKDITY